VNKKQYITALARLKADGKDTAWLNRRFRRKVRVSRGPQVGLTISTSASQEEIKHIFAEVLNSGLLCAQRWKEV
jgi:hypothetical protein